MSPRATSSYGNISRPLRMRWSTELGGAPLYYEQESVSYRPVAVTASQMVYVTNRSGSIAYPVPVPPFVDPGTRMGLLHFGCNSYSVTNDQRSFLNPFNVYDGDGSVEYPIIAPFGMFLTTMAVSAVVSGSGTQPTNFVLRLEQFETDLNVSVPKNQSPYLAFATGSVEVFQGDRISLSIQNTVTGGLAPTRTAVTVGYTVTGSTARNVVCFSFGALPSNTAINFAGPYRSMSGSGATDIPNANRRYVLAHASGVFRNLYVRALGAPTGSGAVVYSVERNAITMSLDVVIPQSGTHAASDNVSSFTVDPGDRISVRVQNTQVPTNVGSDFFIYMEYEETS